MVVNFLFCLTNLFNISVPFRMCLEVGTHCQAWCAFRWKGVGEDIALGDRQDYLHMLAVA